jgi:membrane protein implicated in regulation of membrane protease activity
MKWIADVDNSAISSRAQIRLLNNTFIRLVFSFTAVPFVGIPFAIWIYWLGENTGPTLVWIVIYLLCAGLIRIWHRRYQRDVKENNEEDVRAAGCRILIKSPLPTGWVFHRFI